MTIADIKTTRIKMHAMQFGSENGGLTYHQADLVFCPCKSQNMTPENKNGIKYKNENKTVNRSK